LSYCMVFFMSMMDSPSWRLMLGTLSIPAVIYLALTLFFLPESPRWLVSKGKMIEAKQVLQRLRGREDVSGLFISLHSQWNSSISSMWLRFLVANLKLL
jgi:MFS family permease